MAAPARAAPAEAKKGEVNELRALLRTVNAEKDGKRKRDVIKKVIAYMTLGIDVSRLFPDMIMACNTKDLVIKKMVYLYLSNYAAANAELTLLVINTLQKDCRDEDPMVRGLALRAFTSLRLRSILEYIVAPLKVALTDSSGYVRATAVMGVLKVWHLSPETVKDSDLVDTLYAMIRDREPQVAINAVQVLNEVLAEEGGIAINQPIIHYLLNRLREFSEWGQCTVLGLLPKYTPANEEEVFAIMNLLDPGLKVAHSGVVLASVRAFLALAAPMPDIQRQVFLRLKTPLLTLAGGASHEISYAVLAHVSLIVDRAPGVFDDDFKQFYAKYTEPASLKALKMGILPRVSNAANAREVVSELTEYVAGVDAELSRQAVRAIGDIAIRVPPAAELVVESLLELVETDADYIRSETVIMMQEVLRKYPERAAAVVPSLHRCLKRLEGDEAGKAAVIWMLGEYGQLIDDAPYLLEPLIDGVGEEASVLVRCELLTACVKLFFKRPPEVQAMLARLLRTCLADGVPNLVHDRALLYYRLLRADVKSAASVIAGDDGTPGSGGRPPVTEFHDEVAPEVKEAIWAEFNSLSVLYGKPSSEFIAADHLIAAPPLDAAGAGKGAAAGGGSADDDHLLGAGSEDSTPVATAGGAAAGGGGVAPARAAPAPAPAAAAAEEDDLLGIGFGAPVAPAPAPSAAAAAGAGYYGAAAPSAAAAAAGGLGSLFGGAPAAPPPAPVAPPAAAAGFVPGAVLDPPTFSAKWGSLPMAGTITLRAGRVPGSPGEVEALVRACNVFTVASGDVSTALKFFFFGQDAAGAFHLFQVELTKATGAIVVTVKSEAAPGSPGPALAAAVIRAALRPLPAE